MPGHSLRHVDDGRSIVALIGGLTIALAACSVCGLAVFCASLRLRLRACEALVRVTRERETALFDAALRLATAACESAESVSDEIVRRPPFIWPAVDGGLLYVEREGALYCVASFGERFAYHRGTCVATDDSASLPVRAIAAGHHIRAVRESRKTSRRGGREDLAIPLATGSARCCLVISGAERFDDETVTRLVRLAELAAPAYRTALEREYDRRRAEYDGLTGLLTPRAFRQRLSELLGRARGTAAVSHALLFIDTDHFKHWNDEYGHTAGDALLRELATLLRRAVAPERDLVARNGGDEFCVLFRETEKSDAVGRAEELRHSIAALSIEPRRAPGRPPSPVVRITASIGVAAFPADAVNAADLLECADAAMYHTKATGRDGVSYRIGAQGFTRLA